MSEKRNLKNWFGLKDWLDERYFKYVESDEWQSTFDRGIEKTIHGVLKKPIPDFTTNPVYCLGGIALTAFIMQLITGPLLAMYYRPTPTQAYESVRFIMEHVYLGSLIRSMHHWGANLMAAAVILHMLRVFYTGAYKKPRELTWVFGATLLALTLSQLVLGYALPFNNIGYWATNIVIQVTGAMPFIGERLMGIVQGGVAIGPKTLSRFYVLHVFVIPTAILGVLAIKFALIRRQAISGKRDPDFMSGNL